MFREFVGACVSKVKVNSNMETEWFWLTGDCNPDDLGTRTPVTPWGLTLRVSHIRFF